MDPFRHFVLAQQDVYPQVLAGLGQSDMSRRFALASLDEAEAYLQHAVVGPRLRECTLLVNAVKGRSIHDIFGSPDDMKFHSSMTLFARAVPANGEFLAALARYFDGGEDRHTLALLGIDNGR